MIKNIRKLIRKHRIEQKARKMEKKQKAILAKNNKELMQYYKMHWKDTFDIIPHFKFGGRYYFYLLHSIDENELMELLHYINNAEHAQASKMMQDWLNRNAADSIISKVVQDTMDRYRIKNDDTANTTDYADFIEQLKKDPKFGKLVERMTVEMVAGKHRASVKHE